MNYQEHLEAAQILTRFRGQLAHRYGKPMYMNMVKALDHMCEKYGEIETAKCASLDWHDAELALHHYWEKHKDEILNTQPEEIQQSEVRWHKTYPTQKNIAKRWVAMVFAVLALVFMLTVISQMAINHSDAVIARADRILEAGR